MIVPTLKRVVRIEGLTMQESKNDARPVVSIMKVLTVITRRIAAEMITE